MKVKDAMPAGAVTVSAEESARHAEAVATLQEIGEHRYPAKGGG
jgi:hypothetical protein